MFENNYLRDLKVAWILRTTVTVLIVVCLIIIGTNASTFTGSGCSLPTPIAMGIAVSVLTMLYCFYIIFATGKERSFGRLPWSEWPQLGLDSLSLILWIVALAVPYTIDDFTCFYDYDYNSFGDKVKRSKLSSAGSAVKTGSKYGAKVGFGSIVVVIFAVLVGIDIFGMIHARKQQQNGTAPVDNANPEFAHAEAKPAVAQTVSEIQQPHLAV